MMVVQWYPGHMTKAKRMMQADIKLIDLMIELLDARAPLSSRNPDIDELAKGKSRLILLNKSDLSDDKRNKEWQKYYEDLGFVTLLLDSKNQKGFKAINDSIDKACAAKIERDRKRGIINRPVRAMVAGIPNVGKSTFINSLCKRASTKTGNRPGVTKGKQWIKLNEKVELLDTPGILWPKFEDERIGTNLAYIGSINDELLDGPDIVINLIKDLKDMYPLAISERYKIEANEDPLMMLDKIAAVRGCLKKGNQPDYEKAARIILDDFRSGKLGRITLETV